ncbi:uncharacterized protein TRAVEDRAFT_55653 [Trametes versicolor FP-101664 SS1]|uniref:uncharacterized protein n=1 Tax=Trametes versicolor (strain FP-101664) TaxID=717944 RepID=UPI0004622B3F|nr:uncharacterized protein TRAVEDRAFT_55653 [Trametes versicolor FP-101664 SS1]EIW64830.1 hypothetical protein TRAVEDRAFT_55653 [Trametes versicolor FP-101664 SS1]
MLSFTATVNHVLLLILSIAALHAPRRVAGAPVNATLRLDSPLVSFTPGWRAATFAGDGSQFAFTDGLNEEVLITLPPQTTQIFYRGYKVAGGALFLACVDCAVDVVKADLVGVNSTAVIVDAHDSTENGTQPADTLFSFTDLDPTIDHVLRVFNLEDPAFNNSSQATFDSLIITTDPQGQASGNATATSTVVIVVPNLPTLTVTATESASTGTDSSTTTAPPVNGPIATGTGTTATTTATTATATATSAGLPGATITANPPPSGSTSAGVTTTGTTNSGTATQTGTTPATTTSGVSGTTASTQSTGVNPTGTQTTATSQPGQPGTSTSAPTDPSGTGTTGTSTVTSSNPPNGSPQSTPGGNPSNGATQTTAGGGTATGAGATQSTGDSNPTGDSTPSPSISAVFSGSPANPTGMMMASPAPNSNTSGASTGISKPVIIAIAVVVSLIVLALLGAVLYVLVRNRGGPPGGDKEGQAGLMRETTATPPTMVSAPVPVAFAPMRPQNPFADTVSADIPLDEPIVGAAAFEEAYEVDEVLAQPQPRPPPPPIPPKSPLRGTFINGQYGSPRNSPWLSRVPRNSTSTPPS